MLCLLVVTTRLILFDSVFLVCYLFELSLKKVNLSIEKKSYGVREAIRTLRTNLQFCGDDKRVILVTSCVPREGKSSVSVALAESIADMGKSVILVDADIRNSVMASKLQITGADKGLSHFLSGQCVLADVIMATNIPKFHILLSGPEAPNPTELLESKRFTGMLESMKNVYDYIIIDCPPLGLVIGVADVITRQNGLAGKFAAPGHRDTLFFCWRGIEAFGPLLATK